MAVASKVPAPIADFLETPTPDAWLDAACAHLPEMLLDHANCELKAASTALGFLYRYPERGELAQRMSRLAREELRHFEQVRAIMNEMATSSPSDCLTPFTSMVAGIVPPRGPPRRPKPRNCRG